MTRSFWAAPSLAAAGGLVVVVATGAGWVAAERSRDIGGVALTEQVSTAGTTFAPSAIALGLGCLVVAALLAVLRGTPRRVAGAIAVGVGALAGAVVVRGVTIAFGEPGAVTAAPYLAALGAGLVISAGAQALLRPSEPPAAGRYRVAEEHPTDDEWDVAAGEDDH